MSDIEQGIATPWRRDAEHIGAALEQWARATRGRDVELTELRMPGAGMANDTLLFRLDGEPLVARLAPAPDSQYPTFPTFDLELQHRAIDLVRARTGLPTPEVVHLEQSEEWLGVPFIVVRAIEGEVASDNPLYLIDANGWFLRGSAEEHKRMERSTIEVFARLHEIADDDSTAFLRPAAEGETALARFLDAQHAYYEWASTEHRVPILERAYETLVATLPANAASVLNWGDGRPGNILYRDFEPVGILDWEMAGVGPREIDVAWASFFHRFFAFMVGLGGIEVPAMFDRAETAATYESLTGVTLDDLAWYEALAGFRFGTILLRMSLRSVAYGQQALPANPDDLIVFPSLLDRLLADL